MVRSGASVPLSCGVLLMSIVRFVGFHDPVSDVWVVEAWSDGLSFPFDFIGGPVDGVPTERSFAWGQSSSAEHRAAVRRLALCVAAYLLSGDLDYAEALADDYANNFFAFLPSQWEATADRLAAELLLVMRAHTRADLERLELRHRQGDPRVPAELGLLRRRVVEALFRSPSFFGVGGDRVFVHLLERTDDGVLCDPPF